MSQRDIGRAVDAREDDQEEIMISRVFNSPPAQAWAVYTEPGHVAQWWGLKDMALVSCESEVRVGGVWRFVLRGVDGRDYPFSGIFRVIEPHSRLVYTDGYGEATEQRLESLVTVIFEAQPGGKTKLTKTSVGTPAAHQAKAKWIKAILEGRASASSAAAPRARFRLGP